ncbi:MAG: phytanoyl-CoA dioxygenase family protein, partial [candidate division Zixibacteria bacterium]|nr:phytanoyl-CoA dioxygenase family protein [candidate division Zixibacteria bacterium]
MKVSLDRFMEHGYIILPDVVPPDRLERLRREVGRMVEHRQELSRQQRTPDQPPGGWWEASAQPRLSFDKDVMDADAAFVFECLAGETTLGVCRQLIDAEQIALHNLNCMCSPVSHDFGPAEWHRDIAPGDPAPLQGMIDNMTAHGPSYLQWNIAL